MRTAQQGAASYKDTGKGFPDPAFVLQLPDEVYSGSNLFAVQKHYDGPFQFDVLFESASAKQKLSCKMSESIPGLWTNTLLQLTFWMRVWPRSPPHTTTVSTRSSRYRHMRPPIRSL